MAGQQSAEAERNADAPSQGKGKGRITQADEDAQMAMSAWGGTLQGPDWSEE